MKISWERWESNLGLLGEKRERYLCAMLPPLNFSKYLQPCTLSYADWPLNAPIKNVLMRKTASLCCVRPTLNMSKIKPRLLQGSKLHLNCI